MLNALIAFNFKQNAIDVDDEGFRITVRKLVPPVPASPPPPTPPPPSESLSKAEQFAEATPGLDVSQRFALQTIAKYIPSMRKREEFQQRVSLRIAGETNLEQRARYKLEVARREVAERTTREAGLPNAAGSPHAYAPAPAPSPTDGVGGGKGKRGFLSASSRGQPKAMV